MTNKVEAKLREARRLYFISTGAEYGGGTVVIMSPDFWESYIDESEGQLEHLRGQEIPAGELTFESMEIVIDSTAPPGTAYLYPREDWEKR